MSTGSIAANFHEGSRSEYLAQFVLAGMGTAVAVPHQEDAGIDIYCTITERLGRLSWPIMHFTVQVKSGNEPLEFQGEQSVRWLLDHPLPLFLCVVEKPAGRLRFYQTSQRLQAGLFAPRPSRVRLQPELGTEGKTFGWSEPGDYCLSAPIVDRTISELLNVETLANARECLLAWGAVDAKNMRRRNMGLKTLELPSRYRTNEALKPASTVTMFGPAHEALPALLDILNALGIAHRDEDDRTILALINMLHRHLTRESNESIDWANHSLNDWMGMKGNYVFEGVDHLIAEVQRAVGATPPGP
jgi:hypothetical protein